MYIVHKVYALVSPIGDTPKSAAYIAEPRTGGIVYIVIISYLESARIAAPRTP